MSIKVYTSYEHARPDEYESHLGDTFPSTVSMEVRDRCLTIKRTTIPGGSTGRSIAIYAPGTWRWAIYDV